MSRRDLALRAPHSHHKGRDIDGDLGSLGRVGASKTMRAGVDARLGSLSPCIGRGGSADHARARVKAVRMALFSCSRNLMRRLIGDNPEEHMSYFRKTYTHPP